MKPETFTLCTILLWGIVFFDVALSSDDPSDEVNSENVTEIATPDTEKIRIFKKSITINPHHGRSGSLHHRHPTAQPFGLYYSITLNIYRYLYPTYFDARIGDLLFSCRQDDGALVIRRDSSPTSPQLINGLFEWHPVQGIWWFIWCYEVNSRDGGFALDMTSVQNPAGDSGINQGVLKSLVG